MATTKKTEDAKSNNDKSDTGQLEGSHSKIDHPGSVGTHGEKSAATSKGAALGVDPQMLAKGLGWFSVALGAVEMLAPKRIADAHGAPKGDKLVAGFGAREIAAGIGILTAPKNPAGLWARAVGDVLDIAAAGTAIAKAAPSEEGCAKQRIAIATLLFCAGALALDLYAARAVARERDAR